MPLMDLISIYLLSCTLGSAQGADISKSELSPGESEVSLTSLSFVEGESLIACGKTKKNCTWGTYTLIEGEALLWHSPCTSAKMRARLIARKSEEIFRVYAVAQTKKGLQAQKCDTGRKTLIRQKVSLRIEAPASKIVIAHRTSNGFRSSFLSEAPQPDLMLSEWKFHPAL
jgi:hypothetical protein